MKKETRKKFEEYMDSRPEQSLHEVIYSLTRLLGEKYPNGLKLNKQFENGVQVGDIGQVSDDEMLELMYKTMGDDKETIIYRPADEVDIQNRPDEIIHGHIEVRTPIDTPADFTVNEESIMATMVREVVTDEDGEIALMPRVVVFPDGSHPLWQEDVLNTIFDGLERNEDGEVIAYPVLFDSITAPKCPTSDEDYTSKELYVDYI